MKTFKQLYEELALKLKKEYDHKYIPIPIGFEFYKNPKPSEVGRISRKNGGVFRGFISPIGDMYVWEADIIHVVGISALRDLLKLPHLTGVSNDNIEELLEYGSEVLELGLPIQGRGRDIFISESMSDWTKDMEILFKLANEKNKFFDFHEGRGQSMGYYL